MLSFQLFGGCTLVSDGEVVTGPAAQRRRLALLTVVASAPAGGVSRDKLVGYFSDTIPQVANAGIPNLIALSGNARGLTKEQGLENCALGLTRIMSLAEKHRVTICL